MIKNIKQRYNFFFRYVLIISLGLAFFSCGKKEEKITVDKFAFGTFFKIDVYSNNKKDAVKKIDKAFDVILEIDEKYNSKTKNSLIDKLNTEKKVLLDEEGKYIYNMVKEAYNASNGKYDITILPLMEVWGFSENVSERKSIPTKEELNEAANKIDFSQIELKNDELIIKKYNIKIDTGSFIKGYAVEKAKEKLKEEKIDSALISSVSSVGVIGKKKNGLPWRIGIQNPNNLTEILGVVELDNQSMGVSGDYQTYVEIDGKKYHHIIDKDTKFPVTDKKMVVVVSDDAFKSDLYSTMFFLMKQEEIEEFLKQNKDISTLIINDKNEIKNINNMKFIKK